MIAPATASRAGRLLAYSLELQAKYERITSLKDRKGKGQFFAPPEVCEFMAGLLSPQLLATFRRA